MVMVMKLLVDDVSQDLHIHTDFSDGDESIDSIIHRARLLNLRNISITDHDNMYAYKHINIKELKQEGINLIYGVELSCLHNDKRIHLLAYNINPNLFHLLKPVFYKNFPGHVNKYLSLVNAKKLIHLLGGKLILAHPYKYNHDLKGEDLLKLVIENAYIDGIECFHSYHNEQEIKTLLEYASKYNLLVSAGSDYHYYGRKIRENKSGKGLAYLSVIDSTIEQTLNKYLNKIGR